MYFLFKKSSLGVLNIHSEGMCYFVREFLQHQNLNTVSCRSFYIPNSKEKCLLVLNKRDDEAEKIISEIMNVIGIKTTFMYAHDGASDIDFSYKMYASMRSPWFWCSLAAFVALFIFVGLPGLFWLSFWGSVGWFASKFLMFWRGSSRRSSIGKN